MILLKLLTHSKIVVLVGTSSLPLIAKQSIQSYIKPLTCLINSLFQNGIFPDEQKIAKVITIFKHGDKTYIASYRPISVLFVSQRV